MRNEELIAHVHSSSLRKAILKYLVIKEFSRPVEISKAIGKYQPHVSNVLLDFKKLGLVKCITPSKRSWRVYTLTHTGKSIAKNFQALIRTED